MENTATLFIMATNCDSHTSKLPLVQAICRGPMVFSFGRTNPVITYKVVPIFQAPTCVL